MQRLLQLLTALCLFDPLPLGAGAIRQWHLNDLEQAPLLIVGRVLSTSIISRAPTDPKTGQMHALIASARVQILRSFARSASNISFGQIIAVRFLTYPPMEMVVINRPTLVGFRTGEIRLIPLQANSAPQSDPWMLLSNEGFDLTIRLREALAGDFPQPATARQFILREIANSLSYGTAEESSNAGLYVHNQYENLSAELMPMLKAAIGSDQQRWAIVLVDFMGPQRPDLDDLGRGGWRDANWHPGADHGLSMATEIVKGMPVGAEGERHIIDALMARMAFAPEYTLPIAREYAHNSYSVTSLRDALREQRPGAVYVAAKIQMGPSK